MSRRVHGRNHVFTPPHSRGAGFTLIELLVVIAIIGIIAGVLMPGLTTARREADKLECSANLRTLYTFATLYADATNRTLPIAKGKQPEAHSSLQVLIDYFPLDFKPEVFLCRAGDAMAAETEEDGRFVLDAATNTYAWIGRRTKTTARNRPIGSDKYVEGYEDVDGEHSGHDRGMNVVSTDGSVSFWRVDKLDEDTMLPRGLVW